MRGTAGRTRAAPPRRDAARLPWLLLFCAALSFGFGQLFKWAQRRGCHAPTVVAVNYLVLAALLAAWHLLSGNAWATPASLLVGGAMGASFIVAMLTMTRSLERAPVAHVLTAFRLAILVPVAASMWLWGEPLSRQQAAGIGVALAALVLITTSSSGAGDVGRLGLAGLLMALAVFTTQGVSQVCLRWVHYAGLDGQRLGVLMVCAAIAGALGAVVVGAQGFRPRALDLGAGAGIGLYNLACLGVILTALRDIPGTLFFPATGCLVVLLDGLCAHFWWRERLGVGGAAGVGLGALAMVLVL